MVGIEEGASLMAGFGKGNTLIGIECTVQQAWRVFVLRMCHLRSGVDLCYGVARHVLFINSPFCLSIFCWNIASMEKWMETMAHLHDRGLN